jgi:hypothetical protein
MMKKASGTLRVVPPCRGEMLKSKLEQAAKSGVLHLSNLDLDEIPKEVFALNNLVPAPSSSPPLSYLPNVAFLHSPSTRSDWM